MTEESQIEPVEGMGSLSPAMDVDDEERESLELDLPIQVPSRPATPVVLEPEVRVQQAFDSDRPQYQSDEHIVQVAQELGIDVPPEPRKESLDLSDVNASSLTVSSSLQETNTIQSRNSESTRPTSYNSSEQHLARHTGSSTVSSSVTPSAKSTHSRNPSVVTSATPSIAPSSIHSPERSPYSKIRKSIRRLSTFTKRLSTAPHSPSLFPEPQSFAASVRSKQITSRPSTSQSTARPGEYLRPPGATHKMSAMVLPSLSESRLSAIYPASTLSLNTETNEDDEQESKKWKARERSLRCSRLQRLRIRQLEEQSKFLKVHFEALDQLRAKCNEERRQVTATLKEKQESLQAKHAERNADMETRHLAAEIDLTESLEAERRACDTKLKHMEAYCNNRQSLVPNGPPRKITEDDFRKLAEQYSIRNGMTTLHESRINVLREQQAKQLERIAVRQEADLQTLQDQTSAELDRREEARKQEECDFKKEFEFDKGKLVWRWKVMEAIERKRLELERGEEYGELPDVQWVEDGWLNAAL